MKTILLVIDAGTTSIRSVIYDSSGTVLHVLQQENPPVHYADGRVEHNACSWTDSLFQLLERSAAYAAKHQLNPACISLTAFRSAVVPVGEDGSPLASAVMWQDKRTDTFCSEYESHLDEIYQLTGSSVSSVFSALKMRWFREACPDVYAKTYKMAGIQDLFIHALTGKFYTDESLAGRTGLLNIYTRTWEPRLLELYGIKESLLCDLLEPGSEAGKLTREAASACGLPAGIPVITAGGDQQCAALGSGLLSENMVVSNTGTGSYVNGYSRHPVLDPKRRIFCTTSSVPGSYHLEAGMLSTGTVYRWLREVIGPQQSFKELDQEASSSPPGAGGLLAIPHFKGSGSPYWNPGASGLFYGLTLSTSRGDIARAVLEGIAAEITVNINIMEELSQPVETVQVSGGMAKSAVFNQIQADMMGKQVLQPKNWEATALGAWISAAVTLGIFSSYQHAFSEAQRTSPPKVFYPDSRYRELYDGMLKKKEAVYHALASVRI